MSEGEDKDKDKDKDKDTTPGFDFKFDIEHEGKTRKAEMTEGGLYVFDEKEKFDKPPVPKPEPRPVWATYTLSGDVLVKPPETRRVKVKGHDREMGFERSTGERTWHTTRLTDRGTRRQERDTRQTRGRRRERPAFIITYVTAAQMTISTPAWIITAGRTRNVSVVSVVERKNITTSTLIYSSLSLRLRSITQS